MTRTATAAIPGAPPADATSASVALPHRPSRFGRYFARSGWAHLLLLTGSAIFLFPFVWMIATSLKTDEELQAGGWWPTVPRFRAVSPYAQPAPELIKPAAASEATWRAVSDELQAVAARAAGEAASGKAALPVADSQERRDAAAAVLVNRLAPRIGRATWEQGDAVVIAAFQALLTDDAVGAALDDRTASLEIRALQVRTLEADVFNVVAGSNAASFFRVVSGSGQLIPTGGEEGDATVLAYDFRDARQPIVLRADFHFPCRAEDLHKLILALRPDDSWHRLEATLEVGDVTWTSARPTHLAQHRAASVIFQPPGYDDTTLQPRNWVALVPSERKAKDGKRKAAEREAHAGGAVFTLTITPSSTASAAYAKATRNYARAFRAVPFWRYVVNSLLLVALTTLGTLFSSTFVAYAFARLRWPGRGLAMVVLLSTMMLPAQVTMVPQFLIYRTLGWYNTLNPLWFGAFFGSAFFIFLMTQHMKTIPRELEESARVDGLNAVQTWYYVILPQVKPAAAAIAVMTFMWSWNEFLTPLIYLRDQGKFPLSLGLFAMRLENFGDWSLIMAGNVLMTLPVIVLFFLCQRYFIQGMTMSGMKG